ncbi:MAG: hypothetical protein KJ062_07800 [Thermoanaerobaculia bacterium]|nr:hypothetical protein [Thermoanaerobaculia bacterium]
MKTTVSALALALLVSGAALAAPQAQKADPKMAQSTEKATDAAAAAVAQARADIQKDRNAIVGAAMDLTDAQAGPFWDLYAKYRAARKPAMDRLAALLLEYSKTMDTMTDDQATKLLNEMLSIQKQEATTKAEWAVKFQQKLPGKVVTRFFQVDNKLDAVVLFQLAAEVPLVE